jgi:hypothetical protein
MEFDQFGPEDQPPLLFVLGWGNQPTHEPVQWLVDKLTDQYRVHTATLPVHVTDIPREWVRPVEEYAADLDDPAVLAHSAGGLTVAHADIDADTVTYLSPFWGEPPSRQNPLVGLIARLPTDRKFLPSGIDDPEMLGEHGTAEQIADLPEAIAPTTLGAMRGAHETLPPIRHDAVCFCSLRDEIVSTRAIGENLPSARIVLYDGGHELFSSASRENHLDTLRAVLEDGPDGLPGQ